MNSFTCCAVTINGGSKRSMCSCVQLMSSPCAQRRGDVRSALDVKVHAEHQAFAANFADEIEFRGQPFQSRAQLRAARANIVEQAFLLDASQKLQRHGARQRPAAERRAMQARRKRCGEAPRAPGTRPAASPPASGLATTTMSGRPRSRW